MEDMSSNFKGNFKILEESHLLVRCSTSVLEEALEGKKNVKFFF